MQITQKFIQKNPCYQEGRKITVKGLMLHSVGTAQPNAEVFIRQWNAPTYTASAVHGIIDGNTGIVYQTLPWDMRGWHAGGSANDTHIGIEMAEPNTIKYNSNGTAFTVSDMERAREVATRTYRSAVEIFAYLCGLYKLDPLTDGVIISHSEGALRGMASGHADPEHLWRGLGLPYTMDGFRRDVYQSISPVAAPVHTEELLANIPENYWAADALRWAVQNGVMVGYPDGKLHPDEPITRAEVAQMLYRARSL